MIRLCLVVCALIIVGLSGCTPRYPGCKNDGHCRELERCQGGRCELPHSGPAMAQSSTAMLEMMHTACDGGNLRSCMILGRQYLAGKRAPKDRQKAMGCFNKACDGGHAEGCALAEVERLSVVGSKAWTTPPPVDRQAGKSKKGRRPYWRPGLKRKIVWE